MDEHIAVNVHSDRRTLAGRVEASRGGKVPMALALDQQLVEQLNEAARIRSTSRVALIAQWLSERLETEAR